MKPNFSEELKVKETFVYRWTCPVCGEDCDVRTSIAKVYLSCPICNVTYRRLGITEAKWFLLCEDNHGYGRRGVHPLPAKSEKEDPEVIDLDFLRKDPA